MPELVPDSTATPPDDLQFPWEDHPAFRFTFLLHFTQPGDREALEHIGKMLYDSALELSEYARIHGAAERFPGAHPKEYS
jgi:hypothetical protein